MPLDEDEYNFINSERSRIEGLDYPGQDQFMQTNVTNFDFQIDEIENQFTNHKQAHIL